MRTSCAANQSLIQRLNRISVLKAIREQGPISRTGLTKETGLSSGAITNLTRELIESALVTESYHGNSRSGRKPVLLQFNPNGGLLVGVEIEFDRIAVGALNLDGEILSLKRLSLDGDHHPDGVLEKATFLLGDVLKHLEGEDLLLYGIGVSCLGVMDSERGVCLFSSAFDWNGVEVKKRLEEGVTFPVIVENDLKAETLGEFWFGAAQNVSNLVCLKVENGVGAGVISDGHLFRGVNNMVSEIGHIRVDTHGEQCSCGHRGCLQTKISAPSIVKRAVEGLARHPESVLGKLPPGRITVRDVFEAKDRGDRLGAEIFEEVSAFLGLAVAMVINMYDPEMVILAGLVIEADHHGILESVKEVERHEAVKIAANKVKIRRSSFGENAGVVGAAAVVFHKMISGFTLRHEQALPGCPV